MSSSPLSSSPLDKGYNKPLPLPPSNPGGKQPIKINPPISPKGESSKQLSFPTAKGLVTVSRVEVTAFRTEKATMPHLHRIEEFIPPPPIPQRQYKGLIIATRENEYYESDSAVDSVKTERIKNAKWAEEYARKVLDKCQKELSRVEEEFRAKREKAKEARKAVTAILGELQKVLKEVEADRNKAVNFYENAALMDQEANQKGALAEKAERERSESVEMLSKAKKDLQYAEFNMVIRAIELEELIGKHESPADRIRDLYKKYLHY